MSNEFERMMKQAQLKGLKASDNASRHRGPNYGYNGMYGEGQGADDPWIYPDEEAARNYLRDNRGTSDDFIQKYNDLYGGSEDFKPFSYDWDHPWYGGENNGMNLYRLRQYQDKYGIDDDTMMRYYNENPDFFNIDLNDTSQLNRTPDTMTSNPSGEDVAQRLRNNLNLAGTAQPAGINPQEFQSGIAGLKNLQPAQQPLYPVEESSDPRGTMTGRDGAGIYNGGTSQPEVPATTQAEPMPTPSVPVQRPGIQQQIDDARNRMREGV
jgi:hypothetical protein